MSSGLIDVWDAKTFDRELNAILANERDLIRSYITTNHQIFLDYDLGQSAERPMFRPDNPYASRFHTVQGKIMEAMSSRTIRAWHYTRLTTEEVDILCDYGVYLCDYGVYVSTPKTLRSRLDSLVATGVLSSQIIEVLYAGSPFHSDQLEGRSGKFWMASHPTGIQDRGVERLMKYWGGEVASFWKKNPASLAMLTAIGKPRVIELALPLRLTEQGCFAGKAVIDTFGQTLGCIPGSRSVDLCITSRLAPVLSSGFTAKATHHSSC